MNLFNRIKTGVLECNYLKVKHCFELGAFTVTYKKASELKDDDIVIVLEKFGGNNDKTNNS